MAMNFPDAPTNGQSYTQGARTWIWDGTTWVLQGGSVGYLPLTGGTLTGNLAVKPASGAAVNYVDVVAGQLGVTQYMRAGKARWNVGLGDSVAESGSNAGSDYIIQGYADDGNNPVPAAFLRITRATGATTFSGDVSINRASPGLRLQKTASGQGASLVGMTGAAARWSLELGNGTAEGGASTGSDFTLAAYNDAGAWLSSPLVIGRGTGRWWVNGTTTVLANSRFQITYDGSAAQYGLNMVAGTVGSSSTAIVFTYPPGTATGAISHNATTTTYGTSSDERLKDFIGPYDPAKAIAIIRADPVRAFTWKLDGSEAVGWGAQTSYAISPDLAVPGDDLGPEAKAGDEGFRPWGVDQGKRTPYLWAALSAALDKIDALEARLAALEARP